MNFRSHTRRHPAAALIRYNHILNKTTFNNVLASSHKRRHNLPVSDQTNAYNVLEYAKH